MGRAARELQHDDAFALARWQVARDARAVRRFPELGAHKRARMLASPHAFFRGSAPLFHDLVHARSLLEGLPRAEGFVVGDMHLENVGAYRVDGPSAPVVFDLNDFDDATVGPLALDPLRLAASTLLAGRTFGATGPQSLALVVDGMDAYVRALASRAAREPLPPHAIVDLVRRAEARSMSDFLDKRAPRSKRGRHLVRGPRYLDLPAKVRAAVPRLLALWLEAIGPRAPKKAGTFQVVDAALRVAGTGSLGSLRIAVLVVDDEGTERIVELKEARASSVALALGRPQTVGAGRSVEIERAARALVAQPTRRLAATPAIAIGRDRVSFLGRMLAPQDDKLDLAALDVWSEKEALVRIVFHHLGRAHRRGLGARRVAAPRDAELVRLVDRAVLLAGLFEGISLAYARL